MEMISSCFSAKALRCISSRLPPSHFFHALVITALSFGQLSTAYASETEVFTIIEAGISMNTNTIIIWTQEDATGTNCSKKDSFRISLPATEAYMVYSAAISAMYEGKKAKLTYSEDDCISGSPILEVFRNLNY